MIVFEAEPAEVAHYIIGATLTTLVVLFIGIVIYEKTLRKYLER